MSNNSNINSSDNNEVSELQTPSFTNIINGLQNLVDTANLQANNNYLNSNNGIIDNVESTTENTGDFNPFFNLDSVNETNDSVIFDFSYIFPENQNLSGSDENFTTNDLSILASDANISASDTYLNYTFTTNLNNNFTTPFTNIPAFNVQGSDTAQPVNSEYTNFANELMNYLNGTITDLNIGNSSLTEALNRSFAEKQKYKTVISDIGKRQIQPLTYPDELCNQTSCAITQDEFLKDQEISLLPCGHCFNSDAIMNWLENEKSECPICRFQLDSKEVKVENYESQDEDGQIDEDGQDPNSTTPLFTQESTQQLLTRVMTRAYDNRIQEMQQQEDDELQRAIMASLEESNKPEQESKEQSDDQDSDDQDSDDEDCDHQSESE